MKYGTEDFSSQVICWNVLDKSRYCTISGVCVCLCLCVFMCVCVLTGLRNKKYDRIMRWWDSKPQSVIAQVLDSAAYCYVLCPAPPATIVPTVDTTQVNIPTWTSPVSDPEYSPTTQGHSPNWASPVSVPAFRIPNPPSPSPPVPTA